MVCIYSLIYLVRHAPRREKHLAAVLQRALLNAHECGDFLQNNEKYIALYPRSSALLELFDDYAKIGAEQRIQVLTFWLRQNLDQDFLERLLEAARLTAQEKREIPEIYNLVQRYPKSRILAKCVQEFIEYLHITNSSVFESRSPAQEPSSLEKALQIICDASQQQPMWQFLYDWCVAARFVRRPATFEEDGVTIAESIGRLLGMRNVSPEAYIDLSRRLARAYIEDKQRLMSAREVLCGRFVAIDLLYLLADIAESARDGIRQKRYPRPLFIACIFFAFSFQVAFSDKNEQDEFVRRFLNTLLWDVDEKTVHWLDTEAKKWKPGVRGEWQHYLSQRQRNIGAITLSLPEHMQLWWERRAAFARMRLALSSKNSGRVARVAIDYMTTLSSSDKMESLGDEWLIRVDEAFATFKELVQQQHTPEQGAVVASSVKSHGWKRMVAFIQMFLALWSGYIGRIVRVATEHRDTFASGKKKLPVQWQQQIEAAFAFFMACKEARKLTDVTKEEAIIAAGKRVDELDGSRSMSRYIAPKLTLHERRRKEAAERYCANQTQTTLREWRPKTLQAQSMPGSVTYLAPPRNGEPPKKEKRGIFSWFKK